MRHLLLRFEKWSVFSVIEAGTVLTENCTGCYINAPKQLQKAHSNWLTKYREIVWRSSHWNQFPVLASFGNWRHIATAILFEWGTYCWDLGNCQFSALLKLTQFSLKTAMVAIWTHQNKCRNSLRWIYWMNRAPALCLFVVLVLAPSKVITRWVPTCDSVHSWWLYSAAPLGN